MRLGRGASRPARPGGTIQRAGFGTLTSQGRTVNSCPWRPVGGRPGAARCHRRSVGSSAMQAIARPRTGETRDRSSLARRENRYVVGRRRVGVPRLRRDCSVRTPPHRRANSRRHERRARQRQQTRSSRARSGKAERWSHARDRRHVATSSRKANRPRPVNRLSRNPRPRLSIAGSSGTESRD